MRLIDADALQKWLDDYINEYNHGDWYGSAFNADWVDSVIDNAPTIDAAPVVHGGWKYGERLDFGYGFFPVLRCLKCGAYHIDNKTFQNNFCPNCGAKMHGGNNAEE